MKIFVVDDEEDIRTTVGEMLREEGYEVDTFKNGREAYAGVLNASPDLIVLDWDMPVMDGMTFLEKIREQGQEIPVIFLSINDSEEYRIEGLEKGADDYISKPFSMAELKTRIKVVLRRYFKVNEQEKILRRGNILLNQSDCTAKISGKPVALTVTEFRILEALVLKPGQILSREQLMNAAYPEDKFNSDRSVDSHIKRLRRKIPGDCIKTIYGAGYLFE